MDWTQPPLFAEAAHVALELRVIVAPDGSRTWSVSAVDRITEDLHARWVRPVHDRQYHPLEAAKAWHEFLTLIDTYIDPF